MHLVHTGTGSSPSYLSGHAMTTANIPFRKRLRTATPIDTNRSRPCTDSSSSNGAFQSPDSKLGIVLPTELQD